MLCDLFGCECGKYNASNQYLMCLDAKWKLKWQEYELNICLVNVNVDVNKGLLSIFTKSLRDNCGNIAFFKHRVINLTLQLLLRISTVRITSCCYWRQKNVHEMCTLHISLIQVCISIGFCYFIRVPVMNYLWRYHSDEDF